MALLCELRIADFVGVPLMPRVRPSSCRAHGIALEAKTVNLLFEANWVSASKSTGWLRT